MPQSTTLGSQRGKECAETKFHSFKVYWKINLSTTKYSYCCSVLRALSCRLPRKLTFDPRPWFLMQLSCAATLCCLWKWGAAVQYPVSKYCVVSSCLMVLLQKRRISGSWNQYASSFKNSWKFSPSFCKLNRGIQIHHSLWADWFYNLLLFPLSRACQILLDLRLPV